jgi:DNA-binding NtrC family response regulator
MRSRKPREVALRDLFRSRSRGLRSLLATAEKLVDRDVSVLILGESGTGKNYLAEAIHACGARRMQPFVSIDCASIPHDLFESELFGYEQGTFTDAKNRKIGKLEAATSGTVYFDEIAALAPPLQAKLLRAIEEKKFTRLGGHQNVSFSARVIASTNVDLDALVERGGFRHDLLYRINVVTLTLPPLRDRREDIPRLAKAFLRNSQHGALRGFEPDALAMLTSYSWPGNVRELRNVVERAALLEDSERIRITSLADRLRDTASLVSAAARDQWTLDQLEERYIREIIRQTRSNFSRAATILGINRKTLLEKRRKYGLE